MSMKITELKGVTIEKLVAGYAHNRIGKIVGLGGKLDIRPAYQREFVYNGAQQEAVIESVSCGYPLNPIYFVDCGGGYYALLDGQQRTLSICRFCDEAFSANIFGLTEVVFGGLEADDKSKILNYEMKVFILSGGSDADKLKWFKIINFAGEKLNDQEALNAFNHGAWVTAAREYFSKPNCRAMRDGAQDYLKGEAIRQDYLAKVLAWAAANAGVDVDEYMSRHRAAANADELKDYFKSVIGWVKKVFPDYRREMQGVEWGLFYNQHKNKKYDARANSEQADELFARAGDWDSGIKKSGIYEYLITGERLAVYTRAFNPHQRTAMHKAQGGKCAKCEAKKTVAEMDADHIKPFGRGGETVTANGQMICTNCHAAKTANQK